MDAYKMKHKELTDEVFKKYNYAEWTRISSDVNIYHIPPDIQMVYNKFHQLKIFKATNEKEQREQLAELVKIRRKFKRYFSKLKRRHTINLIKQFFSINNQK